MQVVVGKRQRMVLIEVPIHLRQKQSLIAASRNFAGDALQKTERRVNLGAGQTFAGCQRASPGWIIGAGKLRTAGQRDGRAQRCSKRTLVGAIQKIQRPKGVNAREVASLLVIDEKEKRFILHDRAADGSAKLVTH